MGNNKEQHGRKKAKDFKAWGLISGLPIGYQLRSTRFISHSGLATAPTGGEALLTIRWAALRCLNINAAAKVHAEQRLPSIPHLPEETSLTFRPLRKYSAS